MLRKERPRILTPVNGTSASKHAFEWSCHYARRTHSELLAIYVFEIPMEYSVESHQGSNYLQEGEEILRQIEKIAEAEHCRVSAGMIAARNAGPAIVLEASTRKVNLLVLGAPYRKGSAAVAVGSTTDFVLKNAHLPGSSVPRTCPPPLTGNRTDPMQVLIYGCTRLADALVPVLVQDGHHITVMDTDSDRLAIIRKQADIDSIWIADPLMQDFLIEGKIDSAEAFYSLSEDDHKNLLLCQIASAIYNVPRTMCLLSDPQLQDFYEPLGMRVVNGGHDFLSSAQELLGQ